MTSIFNLLSLFYIFRSLQLGATIYRQWATLTQNPFTRRQKQIAEQASFFIAVPVGVFIHELLHAVPVWAFGGQVVEFAYRVFWGYVRPDRTFADPQEWFISLAGTLGNLLFGLLLWLALRRARSAFLRFFALRAFRFQVFFALIYYPLFTLVLPIGDWRTIYDFGLTPILSAATAVVHLILLGAFLYGDRTGWFEMPAFGSEQETAAFAALKDAAATSPDPRQQLRLVDALRRGGATAQARTRLNQLLKQHPNLAEAHLQQALLQSANSRQISPAAARSAEKALQLGLEDAYNTAVTHQLLAQYHLDRGDAAAALTNIQPAIDFATQEQATLSPTYRAQLYHLRAQAYRRQQQYDLAVDDIQQAIALAQTSGSPQMTQRYQDELATIQRHAGRS